MEKNIYNIEVNSRESFIEFLDLLVKDLKKTPEEWENDKLDVYLETMSQYTCDIQGYYDNTGQVVDADVPSWKTFADIMRGAKIYE